MKNECIANYSIHCTVRDCKYHKGDENYCSLDTIDVGAHEQNPTTSQCVDCSSFSCRHDCANGTMNG